MLSAKSLDIVIPVYNEEQCLPTLLERLLKLKEILSHLNMRFIFVNDGSDDNSLSLLKSFADRFAFVTIINFSRNFGHQIAITAGIDFATAEYVVVIDADLQDPPEVIEGLCKKADEGYDVVYARRLTRKGDTFFKRLTAKAFYRLISKMCDIEIPVDTGDFRLISQRVARELRRIRERHRFVRGLIPWIGFRSAAVHYHRDQRFAGVTKYPFRKMLSFSQDAIFSFSRTPLKVASFVGWVIVSCGVLGSFVMLYIKLMTTLAVPGITAIIITVTILGGIQIIMLGVIGEYIGRIFEQSKDRPLYIISDTRNITTDFNKMTSQDVQSLNK